MQHHHAHIASCMAEHRLSGERRVIGVAFDGTGYGPDGAIWGGEFLLADYSGFERALHLRYFPLPGGDAAIKRPARVALALLWSLGLDWADELPPVQTAPSGELETLQVQLRRGLNTRPTSSMGRLFDAAAALAGVRQSITYEAQAAIEFEAQASPEEPGAYPFAVRAGEIDMTGGMMAMLEDPRAFTMASRPPLPRPSRRSVPRPGSITSYCQGESGRISPCCDALCHSYTLGAFRYTYIVRCPPMMGACPWDRP